MTEQQDPIEAVVNCDTHEAYTVLFATTYFLMDEGDSGG